MFCLVAAVTARLGWEMLRSMAVFVLRVVLAVGVFALAIYPLLTRWLVRRPSHVNAYVRVKLGLTEAEPTIKTYAEEHWAALPDSTGPIAVSLELLEALHRRWVSLLERIGPEEFARTVRHPELGVLRVDQLIGSYDWHGRHHTAHIVGLRRRMGW